MTGGADGGGRKEAEEERRLEAERVEREEQARRAEAEKIRMMRTEFVEGEETDPTYDLEEEEEGVPEGKGKGQP